MKEERRKRLISDQLERIKIKQREKEVEKKEAEVEKKEAEIDFYRTEMFRIDESTPSIDTMEITLSEPRIKQSEEYLSFGQDVLKMIEKKEITGYEGRELLDDKLEELKRRMDARRKHEARRNPTTTTRKKVERDYETLKQKGWDKRDFGMDIVFETNTVEGDMYSVIIPAADILAKQVKPLERPQHYCMASIGIMGSERFYTKTSHTPVLTPDGDINEEFYSRLCSKVKALLARAPDYEERNTELVCCNITMTYTISQWENIKKWYPKNNVAFPKYEHFRDFTVFLASNEEISCEQQCCPRRCCKKWDPTKKFEDMIPQKIVLTYIPNQGDIRYVTQFSDLMTDYHEDVSNTDCKNIARIIKWNDHVAVITAMKPVKKRLRIQTRRPIKVNATQENEVFVDIEAFSSTLSGNYTQQVPYLVCWADGDEMNHVSGKDCMEEFVDLLLKKYENRGEITLYAWYGSGYDYQHIYPYLKKKCSYDDTKLRNNSIIYARFDFDQLKLKIHLKDPFLFILTSLDKAAKAFGVLNKGSFPHEAVKDWDDLDKVLEYWVKIRSQTVEEFSGKRMIVNVKNWGELEQIPNYQTVLEKAIEYCTVDVLALQQIWNKFNMLVQENLNITISRQTFTLSQLSMKLMEATLPKNVWLFVPHRDEYEFVKNAIYGGRVIAKNGEYTEPIIYADVVSLYPSAMRLLEHAYGKPRRVRKIDWEKHGIYDVTLTHKEDEEPKKYMEFVTRRIENKLHWNWFKQHRGFYHTYDLLIAKEEGFKIECHKGIEYRQKGYIFNNFIDKLYTLKEKHSNCDCPEQPCPIRMIAKIALNGGGYGKFVQKPIDVETYIVRRDVIAGECEKLKENEDGKIFFGGSLIKKPNFFQLDGEHYDKMVVEGEAEPYYSAQNGVSILSGSRYRLYKLCKKFPGIKVIYSDTDSVFVLASSVDVDKFRQSCGGELGQLDDTIGNTEHGTIYRMLIGGPKMYAYEYIDDHGMPQTSMHCKGVPTSMLTIKQFEHLLDGDTELAYKFAIMKRRIVGVKGMHIEKEITQT
ncbi:hypothetical protein COEREDRAFT_51958 [Coemansia reversa NRRL 1564]|uniref:Probable DNA polymerase n=1 Tax=Coemansia reversa (strain ATCC 12441 / NRRL 1564) TaxID=763665 RepID=A0A2G5B0J2_COERN|nr:hypothetical protein COEREDRAFT_51958 [Coemansia reversa NRRL 1564]|eukprot:PIA12548.1 hypothetical protein COEREDRAFT_51958 [Coemansia reversa NRRL 1564]